MKKNIEEFWQTKPRRGRPRKPPQPSARPVWKRETWKPYKVLVQRDRRGRFKHWAKIRPKPRARRVPRKETPAKRYARERLAGIGEAPKAKSLAIYGTAKIRRGRRHIKQSRRWELIKPSGMTGQEWNNAVGHARNHPPNEPLKRINADDMAGEYEGEWDDTPKIESA